MISKSILFYWSKGAKVRMDILIIINKFNQENKPCFLNVIANKLKISHVGTKKHVDLLIEEKYIQQINPKGKPIYLELSKLGKEILEELKKK